MTCTGVQAVADRVQYFPKILDFTTITQQEINMAMEKLNNRPRNRLGYQTPNQVFFKSDVALHI